jgi:hypothetical protein
MTCEEKHVAITIVKSNYLLYLLCRLKNNKLNTRKTKFYTLTKTEKLNRQTIIKLNESFSSYMDTLGGRIYVFCCYSRNTILELYRKSLDI